MERSISVSQRVAQLLAFVALMLSVTVSLADDAVVLVTHIDSPIDDISLLDIRKAYLGISVTIEGSTVRPLRQSGDEPLNLRFLQAVIAMSQRTYDRRLLSMMIKYGTPRPVDVDTLEDLLEQLADRPHAIGYMWKSDADSSPKVKTIKVLWQDR